MNYYPIICSTDNVLHFNWLMDDCNPPPLLLLGIILFLAYIRLVQGHLTKNILLHFLDICNEYFNICAQYPIFLDPLSFTDFSMISFYHGPLVFCNFHLIFIVIGLISLRFEKNLKSDIAMSETVKKLCNRRLCRTAPWILCS